MRRIFYLFIVLILAVSGLNAADISVEASLDRNKGLIGDKINYTLRIVTDTLLNVDSIPAPESFGEFELRNWYVSTDTVEDGRRTIEYSAVATVYKTGKVMIPALPVVYSAAETEIDTIYSDSIDVFIMSLVLNDSTADIKSLKDVKKFGKQYTWLYYAIPIAVGLLILIVWFVLRKKPVIEALRTTPLKSPWVEARERLMKLKDSGFEPKPYYIGLSEIIRDYMQRRFGFSAIDMTTYEISQEIPQLNFEEELAEKLMELLNNSDLAKFAKFKPEPEFLDDDFQRAWGFVNHTAPDNSVKGEVQV
jgi:hypothetical protein